MYTQIVQHKNAKNQKHESLEKFTDNRQAGAVMGLLLSKERLQLAAEAVKPKARPSENFWTPVSSEAWPSENFWFPVSSKVSPPLNQKSIDIALSTTNLKTVNLT